METNTRERLGSRLGFILLSAGCAIGLGNVWRFPYVTGEYGGAAFVLLYLFFLVFLGLPILVMEFSVGRASQRNIGLAFKVLKPNTKWNLYGHIAIIGNYLLLMFYTVVSGWVLAYCYHTAIGSLAPLNTNDVALFFTTLLNNPLEQIFWTALTIFIGVGVCSLGLQKGVERITKIMMIALLFIIVLLAARSLTLPNAMEGVRFYLYPDFSKLLEKGLWTSIYAAMGQAFFTLSIGMGCMTIFGSYISKERSLTGESINILILDTFIGLMAGLIIFPASFSFGVAADAGPGLIFITLPNIFNSMYLGQIWGTLFFIFMSFASLSTVIAVLENITAYGIDVYNIPRKKSVITQGVLLFFLAIPCVLGFNILSDFQPLGKGTNILDLEDFIVSSNILPIGSLIYLFFCCYRKGWGWENFINEANTGKGIKFPKLLYGYVKYILPVIILVVFVQGYIEKFFK